MEKCSIGVDFGTESARFVLVRTQGGHLVSDFVVDYPNGVMDQSLLRTGPRLPPYWALQEPRDYLDVLRRGIPGVIEKSGIHPEQVVGIGVDFTSCTMMPVDERGEPLCWYPSLVDSPHSWVKLWKHRAAHSEADAVNSVARERKEAFLKRYPTGISPEWMLPKILQALREAPEVFQAADRFVEAADWVVWQLTGSFSRNSCAAGYKAMWSPDEGYPSEEYLASVHPGLRKLASTKLRGQVLRPGTLAGRLSHAWADGLGLLPGTPVAVPIVDAHAGVLGAGVTGPGKMVLVTGTSMCHMLLLRQELAPSGVAGVVKDGIIPGLYAYEAGQAAAGDMLAWFVESIWPDQICGRRNVPPGQIHDLLSQLASRIDRGSHGIVLLDWWNGSRFLGTSDVCGVIVGLSLSTRPEHLYLALIESLAFGTKLILDSISRAGGETEEVLACGPLARNPLIAQIFADVIGLPLQVLQNPNVSALGAAILGAVAAGEAGNGYGSLEDACANMVSAARAVVYPKEEHREAYGRLYGVYTELHGLFTQTGGHIMKGLNEMRRGAAGR